MANFEKIDAARKTLGLLDSATLEEIKSAYRRLASECHPDKLEDADKKRGETQFKQLTEARDILFSYCANHRYSFKQKDVEGVRIDQDFNYDHVKQFYDDWMVNP
ncbi:DnaJ domain-containing protein [candidate division KSB1 bacterium]|nr:DnaJ domain-containing protein [candidate division KSB1 bacterium]